MFRLRSCVDFSLHRAVHIGLVKLRPDSIEFPFLLRSQAFSELLVQKVVVRFEQIGW